jgi:hypothetical protein
MNQLYALFPQNQSHFEFANFKFLPFLACQAFVSVFTTSKSFRSSIENLYFLLIQISIENIAAAKECALGLQLHSINEQLENLASQKTHRESTSSAINSRNFKELRNQKRGFSKLQQARTGVVLQKMSFKLIRKFRRQEIVSGSSKRKVCPVAFRETTTKFQNSGTAARPLPWSVQAARIKQQAQLKYERNIFADFGTKTHHSYTSDFLQEIRLGHGHLCDIADCINCHYGPEVLMTTTLNFCKLVAILCSLIRDIILQGAASALLITITVTNFMRLLARILYICYRCEKVHFEVRSGHTPQMYLMKTSDCLMAHTSSPSRCNNITAEIWPITQNRF